MTIYSLYDLQRSIRGVLERSFTGRYWIKAETSGIVNGRRRGHFYFDLIEKNPTGHGTRARASAVIWQSQVESLLSKFAAITQQPFGNGLNVLLFVSVQYHEQFGLTLIVEDIDPSFTLGDIAQRRIKTIQQLTAEGLLNKQKELTLPTPIRHIAVISSPSAAGWGDFLQHIEPQQNRFPFLLQLYPALMQGKESGRSIIQALRQIECSRIPYDCVVIIRGGGANSDLIAFDDYILCSAIATFKLPIIVGIGHERDNSVADLVAYLSLKTPTAVAEYLINSRYEAWQHIQEFATRLANSVTWLRDNLKARLAKIALRLPTIVGATTTQEKTRVTQQQNLIQTLLFRTLTSQKQTLAHYQYFLQQKPKHLLREQRQKLEHHIPQLRGILPKRLLNERLAFESLVTQLPRFLRKNTQQEYRQLAILRITLERRNYSLLAEQFASLDEYNNGLTRSCRSVFKEKYDKLQKCRESIVRSIPKQQKQFQKDLDRYERLISLLQPCNTLQRGYSIVRKRGGKVLYNCDSIALGDAIEIQLARGILQAEVTDSLPENSKDSTQVRTNEETPKAYLH